MSLIIRQVLEQSSRRLLQVEQAMKTVSVLTIRNRTPYYRDPSKPLPTRRPRKPLWLPVAPSKMWKVREPEEMDPEEKKELQQREAIYRTTRNSMRYKSDGNKRSRR